MAGEDGDPAFQALAPRLDHLVAEAGRDVSQEQEGAKRGDRYGLRATVAIELEAHTGS